MHGAYCVCKRKDGEWYFPSTAFAIFSYKLFIHLRILTVHGTGVAGRTRMINS